MSDPKMRSLAARYSARAREYDTIWSPVIRPMSAPLFPRLPDPGSGVVVEVGCGTAILSEDVHAVWPDARIVGADLSEGMAAVASARVPALVADAALLPIRSESVAAAYVVFMLQHTPDPLAVIKEMGRVVKPGGTGATVTWAAADTFAGEEIFDELLNSLGAAAASETHRTTDLLDNEDKVRAAWSAAGFSAIETWTQQFEVPWTFESLVTTYGFCFRDRYVSLGDTQREVFLKELRARIDTLTADQRRWRDAAVFVIARKPA